MKVFLGLLFTLGPVVLMLCACSLGRASKTGDRIIARHTLGEGGEL